VKHFAPLATIALLAALVAPSLGAQRAARKQSNLEISFQQASAQFLRRVSGQVIDTAAARQYLAENHLAAERILAPSYTVARVLNVSHVIDEEEYAQPGLHTAALRFRADLVVTDSEEPEDAPDIFFTVIFEHRGDQWVKTSSLAVWDVDPMLPPNDLRYGMRPFSSELGARLNDLPAFP
jgi:type II secretory pathway pseudopilin PulG